MSILDLYNTHHVIYSERSRELGGDDSSLWLRHRLNLYPNSDLCFDLGAKDSRFLITGCHGTHSVNKKQVAIAINQHSGNVSMCPPNTHTFGLFLGDNFYNCGVSSPNSDKFIEQFKAQYNNGMKWFSLLGNHDWNFQHPFASIPGMRIHGYTRALAQVDHTYLLNPEGTQKVSPWYMPHRYYALRGRNFTLYILDSNTFPFDKTQQTWFLKYEQSDSSDNHRHIIAMHHPLESQGKRHPQSDHFDLRYYLYADYKYMGSRDTTLNAILLKTFQAIQIEYYKKTRRELKIHLILCAHDHFMAAKKITSLASSPIQVTLGSGGGALQNILNQDNGIFAEKTHGFAELQISQGEMQINTFNKYGALVHTITC